MKYGLENPSSCEHSWNKPNEGGVSKCSECGRESVMRTTIPVKVLNDASINEKFVFLGKSFGDVYNMVIKVLCEKFDEAYAKAVIACDEYAETKGIEKFMLKVGNMKRQLPSVFDLNLMLTQWRHNGDADPSVSADIQRADVKRARSAFLQKYNSHREGIYAVERRRKNNQKVRNHNANIGEGEKKWRVKHPKRKDHSKSDIDMSNPKPMLREENSCDRLFFSTASDIEIRGDNRNIVKASGLPEFAINRSIPEGIDIRSLYLKERTRYIRENIPDSKRLWEVRLSIRCLIPEKQTISETDEKIIAADTGCENHIATSEGELWSAPATDASHRKTRVWDHQLDKKHKNGSHKHKRISKKKNKETSKRSKVKKSAKQNKAAEIAEKADTIVQENLEHTNMKASAKGTIDRPGKNVAAKRGLNRALQHAAMGETQTLTQEAAQNRNKLCVYIDPYNTSNLCSECDTVDKTSRVSRDLFDCQHCDYKDHADINPTKNMIKLYKGGKVNLKFKNGKIVVPGRISSTEKASLISMSTAPAVPAGNHADIDPIQVQTSRDGPAAPAAKSRRASGDSRRQASKKETSKLI